MAMIGMDVDEVHNIGVKLKTQAGEIASAIAAIDGLIQHALSVWQGQDAVQFQDWWTNTHKPALTNAQHAVDGLGQSAMNNASEQREVSGR